MNAGDFAAIGLAAYAAHHVGDYWIQTDHQARHKGADGRAGVEACTLHVLTYLITQVVMVGVVIAVFSIPVSPIGLILGFGVSGVTHYLADRREHGIMFDIARMFPGKANFLKLGVPREPVTLEMWGPCPSCEGRGTSYDESTGGKCWDCKAGGMLPTHVVLNDNPSLGTGGWALDQAWHIFFGVFMLALLMAAL